MKLYLMRHGESENNIRGIVSHAQNKWHLTPRGRQQVNGAMQRLRAEGVNMIICSPLLRTRESADIACKYIKARKVVSNNLTEIQMGVWSDRARKGATRALFKVRAIARKTRFFQKTHFLRGGESFYDLSERMIRFVITDLARLDEESTALIISHADPIFALQKIIQSKPARYPNNAEIIEMEFSLHDCVARLTGKLCLDLRNNRIEEA